jgi:hypothetical protein
MTDIIVIRGQGDRPGDDITEPFLATVQAALARGRAELDARSDVARTVRLTTLYRSGVRLGQLAEVYDALQGMAWRGKITGITHHFSGSQLITDLDIERHESGQ